MTDGSKWDVRAHVLRGDGGTSRKIPRKMQHADQVLKKWWTVSWTKGGGAGRERGPAGRYRKAAYAQTQRRARGTLEEGNIVQM